MVFHSSTVELFNYIKISVVEKIGVVVSGLALSVCSDLIDILLFKNLQILLEDPSVSRDCVQVIKVLDIYPFMLPLN